MKKIIRLSILGLCVGLLALMGCQRQRTVAMVTFDGTFSDGAYNQLCKSGLDRMGKQAKLTYLDGFEQDESLAVNELLSLKADLILVIHHDEGYAVTEGAKENPEQQYVALDQRLEQPLDNVTGTSIRAEEGSFLAGYAAGSLTQTGKVGFIGGMNIEPVEAFAVGYRAGVAYAAKERNQTILVETKYLDSFTDAAQAKAAAQTLYSDGCDVLFQAAGEAGLGAIAQAQEMNKWIIGVDQDQHELAPGQVVASVVKRSDVVVEDLTRRFLAGEQLGGKNFDYGIKEGVTGLSTTGDLLPAGVQTRLKELEEQIKSGQLRVPAE